MKICKMHCKVAVWLKRFEQERDKDLIIKAARRQMLHAWRLGFTHPLTGQWMEFEAPLPDDMAQVIKQIRQLGL